jgi:hypothetical protein
MLVFSNRRLGPAAELSVSHAVAGTLLAQVANTAREEAVDHWELELVRWLDEQSLHFSSTTTGHHTLDVGDIAFTPQHFDRQRRFLIDAITRARSTSPYSRLLAGWADLIEAHPRDSVQFGRRWVWHSTY